MNDLQDLDLAPLRTLAGELFIHASERFPLRHAVAGALAAAGVAPRVVMALQSLEGIKAHVAAGLGYGAIGEHSVAHELAEGRVVRMAIAGPPLKRQLGLIYRENAPLAPAVEAFLNWLRGA